MTRAGHIAAITLCSLLVTAPMMAQSSPPMPQRFIGYCEGENCSFGCRAVALSPVALLTRDERGAPVSAHLSVGDTVTIETGNLAVLEPGIVVLLRDTVIQSYPDSAGAAERSSVMRFARGDTLHLLAYIELGRWHWWYRGRRSSGEEFWSGKLQRHSGPGRGNLAALIRSEPVADRWRFLVAGDGRKGWWLARDRTIEYVEDNYCA